MTAWVNMADRRGVEVARILRLSLQVVSGGFIYVRYWETMVFGVPNSGSEFILSFNFFLVGFRGTFPFPLKGYGHKAVSRLRILKSEGSSARDFDVECECRVEVCPSHLPLAWHVRRMFACIRYISTQLFGLICVDDRVLRAILFQIYTLVTPLTRHAGASASNRFR